MTTRSVSLALVLAAMATGCSDDAAPGATFYDRNIQPIFDASCTGNVAGCHAANDDDPFAFAAGNLDLTDFDNVQLRRDSLRSFGAYPVPLLLVKAVGATCDVQIPYRNEFLCIEAPHGGGAILQVGSPAYLTLQTWMENGATANGLSPAAPAVAGEGACSPTIPPDFDPAVATGEPSFAQFRDQVAPVLASCGSGTCHGAPQADFYITCGDTPEQLAFNFSQARAFVATDVENSELLRRPLAVADGGYAHTGGDQFASRSSPDYTTVRDWAEAAGPVVFGEGDPGRAFFAERIQPLLLSRGCSFEACHSPQAFNDLKLRQGSTGLFSAIALERNYDLLRDDFMALEHADARASRAVAKGILPRFGGIAHRGGSLLETPGAGASAPAACPVPYNPTTASAFCSFQEWVRIERQPLIAAGQATPLDAGDTVPIVFVDRDADHVASPLEFDTYQAGSDLRVADAVLGIDGSIASVGSSRSLLAGCAGADRATADVSSPSVSIDGNTVAFALRRSADEGRRIYAVGIDGGGCREIAPAGFPSGRQDGIMVHNFDPAFSPDGKFVVFASTRGGPGGPTVSRKLFLPQSDIWRMRIDGGDPVQMTVLTDSELSPGFMREGRVTMTTEKVSAGFYQLSGRRINWDLTDYHPLLAQRAQSLFCSPEDPTITCPSVDYAQATDIVEGANGNFLLVLSDVGARAGAGTLATFNRSIGPFEAGRRDPGYLASMIIVDRAATGRVGQATSGAYRSPASLPDGGIMVSYAGISGDLGALTSIDYDVVATRPCVPPAPGATCTPSRTTLIGGQGQQVEAVLAIARPPHELFDNRRQLVFGGGVDLAVTGGADKAVVHMLDAPTLFTLLTANLRRGRPVELFAAATHVAAFAERPAPAGTTAGNQADGHYEDRQALGRAALRDDGSAKLLVPSATPLVLELQDDAGNTLIRMTEAHQMGPGEVISMGVSRPLFDAVCGGCHGPISGRELDIQVTPDALTGASQSLSADAPPVAPN